MKAFAALVCAALVGCSTVPKEVLVPVAQPCDQVMPPSPTYSYKPGTYTQVFPLVKDLLSDRELANAHITELEAAVQACIK